MKKNNFIGKVFLTNSPKKTQDIACRFAKILEKGDVVCLYGDLGSGKTTFVQGLANGLGMKNRIISPTFVIIRSYELKIGIFYHLDLYRTENEKDFQSLGLDEILNNKKNIVVVEWAEKLNKSLPKKRIDIELSYEKDDVRKITFRSSNQ